MISNWLNPVKLDIGPLDEFQWGTQIKAFDPKQINFNTHNIALLSIEGDGDFSTKVRQELYKLSLNLKQVDLYDLGEVKGGEIGVIEVTEHLRSKGILPILIANDPQLAFGQFKSYERDGELINVALVDSRINALSKIKPSLIDNLLAFDKKLLFHLTQLAYQSYFVNPEVLQLLQDRHFECFRVGKVKVNLEETEPMVRDADLLMFNLSSMRSSDAPAGLGTSPGGLYTEEAFSIIRYAGMSNKLSSLGIYGIDKNADDRSLQQNALFVAQLIWYFFEGFENRKNDFPPTAQNSRKYTVDSKLEREQITFWKSNISDRWWLQIPKVNSSKQERHRLIPCSYNDYLLASREELPDRLIEAYLRFQR